MIYLYVLLTVILILLLHNFWKSRNLPPGPWGAPIVGYLPWLNAKAPYLTLTDLSKRYGPIYGLSLGNVYTVVLTDAKIIKSVFAKDVTTGRAPLYLTHGIMQGYGVICAEGELWKDQRRFVHNCLRHFGASRIGSQRKQMEKCIIRHVVAFVDHIKEHNTKTNSTPLDPLEPLRHSMGSIINLIVFGKSWPREDETWIWLQNLQEEGVKHIGVAGPLNFLPFLRFVPYFKKTMNFLLEGKLKTHKFYQKLIDEEKLKLEKKIRFQEDPDTDCYTNLIQGFLLERRKRQNSEDVTKFYNDQQFYHMLADIFGAGLDTTLTTLRWFLLYMAKNGDIQTKIKQEIKEVLGNKLPTLEDIVHMPLTEAAICETQRIRPVVPLGIPHGSLQSFEIAGYHIPQGTMIVPLQWAIHMDEQTYPKPEEFNPWNFLDRDGKFSKKEAFIPFQNGKRMCIGDELAKMMLYLFGTTILQYFSLELQPNENNDLTVGDCGITLTPKSHKIKFFVDFNVKNNNF